MRIQPRICQHILSPMILPSTSTILAGLTCFQVSWQRYLQLLLEHSDVCYSRKQMVAPCKKIYPKVPTVITLLVFCVFEVSLLQMLARGHTKLIQQMSLGKVDVSLFRKSKIYYTSCFFLPEIAVYLGLLCVSSPCSGDALICYWGEMQRLQCWTGRGWGTLLAPGAMAQRQNP